MSNDRIKTQIDAVLDFLERNGSITSMQAIENFGATRLSGIIYTLRNRGYNITTTLREVKNRYGRMTHIAVYKLE